MTVGILMQGTNENFSSKTVHHEWKTSDRDFDFRFQPVSLHISQFQNQGNSILIGLFSITSMSISQNDMTQQTYFREKIGQFLLKDSKTISNKNRKNL